MTEEFLMMRWLVYIVILVVGAGCGVSTYRTPQLDEAQRLMHSDPGAALATLNGVDFQPRKSKYKGSPAAEAEMNRL